MEECIILTSQPDMVIRPYRSSDALKLYEGVKKSMHVLLPRLSWCKPNYSYDDASEFISQSILYWQRHTEFQFGIFSKDNQFLGSIGFHHYEPRNYCATLGYWIVSDFHGKKIATSVGKAIALFGFKDLNLHRIEIVTAVDNIASQKTALAIGARFEGKLRNRFCNDGTQIDARIYSITPEDFL